MRREHLAGLSGLDTFAVWGSLMVDHTAAHTLQRYLESLADGG